MSDISSRLRDAAKRAKWYQTGEWGLLLAAAEEIERKEREIQEAEARGAAIEREAIAAWHDDCAAVLDRMHEQYMADNHQHEASEALGNRLMHETSAQAIRAGKHHEGNEGL